MLLTLIIGLMKHSRQAKTHEHMEVLNIINESFQTSEEQNSLLGNYYLTIACIFMNRIGNQSHKICYNKFLLTLRFEYKIFF